MPRKIRDISQALLKAIEQKLEIKRRAIDYRIQSLKEKYNLEDDEVAICLLCYDESVNISPENPKYFDKKKGYAVPKWAIDDAKRNLSAGIVPQTQELSGKVKTLPDNEEKAKYPPDIKIQPDPILPYEKLEEAKLIARKVYPYIYILENSIREFIKHVMENQLYPGQNWWNLPNVVPDDVKNIVARNKRNEAQNPWLGGKSSTVHEIYYTSLWHLASIITHDHNWEPPGRPNQGFKSILGRKNFINYITEKVSNIRNNIMHSNPIKRNIINKAKQVLQEWQESPAVIRYGSQI